METKLKSLPADVPLSDGTIVHLASFQAKQFTDAAQDAARQGMTDGIEISLFLLTRIGMMQVAGYKAGDAQAHLPLTIADLDAMDQFDIMTLMEYLTADVKWTDSKSSARTVDGKPVPCKIGTLPSGKMVSMRRATGADLRKAGKMNGEENRNYSMISLTCQIDNKDLDFVDVQLMDGADFIALNTALNTRPT